MTTSIAAELTQTVEAAFKTLNGLGEDETSQKPAADKWSKKQILGHLIDSASNNHQRFVRAQETEELSFPKYEQKHWVEVQGYDESRWKDLVELWKSYNLHLAQVINRIPDEKLQVSCRIGPSEPVTLGFLVEDYLIHLKHHLKQLGVA